MAEAGIASESSRAGSAGPLPQNGTVTRASSHGSRWCSPASGREGREGPRDASPVIDVGASGCVRTTRQ